MHARAHTHTRTPLTPSVSWFTCGDQRVRPHKSETKSHPSYSWVRVRVSIMSELEYRHCVCVCGQAFSGPSSHMFGQLLQPEGDAPTCPHCSASVTMVTQEAGRLTLWQICFMVISSRLASFSRLCTVSFSCSSLGPFFTILISGSSSSELSSAARQRAAEKHTKKKNRRFTARSLTSSSSLWRSLRNTQWPIH